MDNSNPPIRILKLKQVERKEPAKDDHSVRERPSNPKHRFRTQWSCHKTKVMIKLLTQHPALKLSLGLLICKDISKMLKRRKSRLLSSMGIVMVKHCQNHNILIHNLSINLFQLIPREVIYLKARERNLKRT